MSPNQPMLDHFGLTILHNRSRVHNCKYSFNFFKKGHVKTKLMPAKGTNLNVIEHVLDRSELIVSRNYRMPIYRTFQIMCGNVYYQKFMR